MRGCATPILGAGHAVSERLNRALRGNDQTAEKTLANADAVTLMMVSRERKLKEKALKIEATPNRSRQSGWIYSRHITLLTLNLAQNRSIVLELYYIP